jgi:hypothetical protein
VDWLRTPNWCDDCGARWLAPFGETLDSRCVRCSSHATVVVKRRLAADVLDLVVHWVVLTLLGVAVALLAPAVLFYAALTIASTTRRSASCT